MQELAAVIAPKLLGGTPARTPLGDLELTTMAQVATWPTTGRRVLGPDLLWQLRQPED